jgi:Flp pilus assembly protein CpaB
MEFANRLIATRRGTILTAAGVAVLAGILIIVYVDKYRNSVKSEGTPVTVLVARQTIPKGTAGNVIAAKGLYTASTIRQGQLLEGAFSDPSSLRGEVATHDIYPGAQLVSTDFAASTSEVSASLTDNQRVISIPFDSSHGALNELQSGDRVDIFAGFNVQPVGSNGQPLAGGAARPVLRRIMGDVQVIGIGSSRNGGFTGNGGTNVELKVTDDQAAQLAFASDNGKLWLVLRPTTGAKSSPPAIQTVETVLLGVPPVVMQRVLGVRR